MDHAPSSSDVTVGDMPTSPSSSASAGNKMTYAEAVSIVTMPHIPCIFENVISVAESAIPSGQLSNHDMEALESLVDSIHDLQEAASEIPESQVYLACLSRAVGIEDVTYNEVKTKLLQGEWSSELFDSVKQHVSAYLQARSRVLFNATRPQRQPPHFSQMMADSLDGSASSDNRRDRTRSRDTRFRTSSTNSRASPTTQASARLKGRLILRIIQARDLPALDFNGKSDPYCIVSLEFSTPPPRSSTSRRQRQPSRATGSTATTSHKRNHIEQESALRSQPKNTRVSIKQIAGKLWRRISAGSASARTPVIQTRTSDVSDNSSGTFSGFVDPTVYQNEVSIELQPDGGRRTRMKLAQTKAVRNSLAPHFEFVKAIHLPESTLSLLVLPPRISSPEPSTNEPPKMSFRKSLSRLSAKLRSGSAPVDASDRKSDAKQTTRAGAGKEHVPDDLESKSHAPPVLRFSWFDKDFMQADEFIGSHTIPLRDFIDPQADDQTQLMWIETDKFAALTGDKRLLSHHPNRRFSAGDEDAQSPASRRVVVVKNRWYQVDDNTSGYFQLQSIFIPAPNKTSSSNAVSTASSARADSVSVKTSFSSVGPVEDSEQHAVDSSTNSNSQLTTETIAKLRASEISWLSFDDEQSPQPTTPHFQREHPPRGRGESSRSRGSATTSSSSGSLPSDQRSRGRNQSKSLEVNAEPSCMDASQGECAALQTAVACMYTGVEAKGGSQGEGLAAGEPVSPSSRAARSQLATSVNDNSTTDSVSNRKTIGAYTTELWKVIPQPGMSAEWLCWDRCGFPLDPDLRAEWAVARSLEDCTEAKQLEKWWGVGGLSAITRAMFSNSASVSEPPSLDPELFWNGIPHEMRKGVYLRVMQATRDEVVCSIAAASATADGSQSVLSETWSAEQKAAAGLAYYNHLVERAKTELPHSLRHQIAIDLPRTFPDSKTAMSSDSGRNALRRVLHAYAIRNSVLGYCQSLNFVVGFLLAALDCSEEEAFWLLVALAESIVPGYYVTTMQGVVTDCRVLERCIDVSFPAVSAHMANLCVSVEALATSPLMSLYLLSLPSMTVLRLLDVIFADRLIPGQGSQVLIGVVLALIRKNRRKLLAADGLPEFCDIFREAQRHCFESSKLLSAARSELATVARKGLSTVQKLRDDLQLQVADGLESRRYEIVMAQLCPPESNLRHSLFQELRTKHEQAASDDVRARIGRGGKLDPMKPYWDVFMANASASHGLVVGPGGLGSGSNVRRDPHISLPKRKAPRTTLIFGRRQPEEPAKVVQPPPQRRRRAQQEIVDYRRLNYDEFKSSLQQILPDSSGSEDVSTDQDIVIVSGRTVARSIGFLKRRRRHRYNDTNQSQRQVPDDGGPPSTKINRSGSFRESDFLKRVYDIEVEDPLLNTEALFASFDRRGVGSISVQEFLCGIAVTSLGTMWTEAHRLQIAFRLFDRAGGGSLSLEETRNLLSWLHSILQTDCTAEEIEWMGEPPSTQMTLTPAANDFLRHAGPTAVKEQLDGEHHEPSSDPQYDDDSFGDVDADGADAGTATPVVNKAVDAATPASLEQTFLKFVAADRIGIQTAQSEANTLDDESPQPKISFDSFRKLVRLQPRLQTHLCTLYQTTAHSSSISLAEHEQHVRSLKAEHARSVEFFRVQSLKHLQTIDTLRKEIEEKDRKHERMYQLQKRQCVEERSQSHAKEEQLLFLLREQEDQKTHLQQKLSLLEQLVRSAVDAGQIPQAALNALQQATENQTENPSQVDAGSQEEVHDADRQELHDSDPLSDVTMSAF